MIWPVAPATQLHVSQTKAYPALRDTLSQEIKQVARRRVENDMKVHVRGRLM